MATLGKESFVSSIVPSFLHVFSLSLIPATNPMTPSMHFGGLKIHGESSESQLDVRKPPKTFSHIAR